MSVNSHMDSMSESDSEDDSDEKHEQDSAEKQAEEANDPSKSGGFYGKYEVLDILGRGMASIVRKCLEKSTGAAFAVKIVDITTEHQSEEDAQRLKTETKDEVEILRLLQGHPNIIELHDLFETTTYLFLVFELAPLGELFDVLTKDVTFSEKRTKRFMRQIFSGMAHMHKKSIMHRDMKLENLLCINENKVIITDFGFARRLKPGEKVRDLCGTPGYLAPETLKAQMYENVPGYSIEVDMWACGVIMYTLLAGYAPFYHRRQMMMLRMIQEGKYEFRAEQWDAISQDAKDMITRLLCVEPAERLTAEGALAHPFLAEICILPPWRPRIDPRRRLRRAGILVLFLVKILHIRERTVVTDRAALRKRPYRDRAIRHETEATVFTVFGHWVNKGFYESRDMLFANRPRPKRVREPPGTLKAV